MYSLQIYTQGPKAGTVIAMLVDVSDLSVVWWPFLSAFIQYGHMDCSSCATPLLIFVGLYPGPGSSHASWEIFSLLLTHKAVYLVAVISACRVMELAAYFFKEQILVLHQLKVAQGLDSLGFFVFIWIGIQYMLPFFLVLLLNIHNRQ